MKRASLAAASIALATFALAAPASADAGPKFEKAIFLPVGVNVGAAIHPKLKTGFLFGGDLSAVFINGSFFWAGGFADALGDFGLKAFRYNLGPEVGIGPLGFDTGYSGELRAGTYRHGLSMRVHLTIAFIGLYGRWGHRFGDPTEPNFGEVGVLFKFPALLWEKRVDWQRRTPAPTPPGPVQPVPAPQPAPTPAPAPEPPRDFATPPPSPPAAPLQVPNQP
jgi:hypothetical protein